MRCWMTLQSYTQISVDQMLESMESTVAVEAPPDTHWRTGIK